MMQFPGDDLYERTIHEVPKGSRHNRGEITKFNDELKKLEPYTNTDIKELPPDILSTFNQVKATIGLLYEDQLYHDIYRLVQNTFGCSGIKDGDLKPGTLLSYFCGCVNSNRNSCSIYCAAAMPEPLSSGGSQCADNVVFAYCDGGSRTNLSFIKEMKYSRRAIIYVKYADLDRFPGFNHSDIQMLREKQIEEVKLLPYPLSGRTTTIDSQFVALDKLPMRVSDEEIQPTDSVGITVIAIVLFLALVFALVYLLVRN